MDQTQFAGIVQQSGVVRHQFLGDGGQLLFREADVQARVLQGAEEAVEMIAETPRTLMKGARQLGNGRALNEAGIVDDEVRFGGGDEAAVEVDEEGRHIVNRPFSDASQKRVRRYASAKRR